MSGSKMDDLPLPTLFEQARNIYHSSLEECVDMEVTRKGCQILKKCEEMIRIVGMFSANETKEDISTTDLKYIMVPFYLAELTEKVTNGERIEILKASQERLKDHLSFCEAMELVPKEELEMYVRGGLNDIAERRAKKIARFRRQRARESKLLEIMERKERRGRSTRAAALSSTVDTVVEDTTGEDDEEEREMWMTEISLSICRAIDLLEMMRKEEEMLELIKEKQIQKDGDGRASEVSLENTRSAESRHREAADRARHTKPAQPITCAAFAQDVLEGRARATESRGHSHSIPMVFGPASLVNGSLRTEREMMVAKVFQPGHRLPTVSIEEAGVREMEMMNLWQERNRSLLAEANPAWHVTDGVDEEEEDEERTRAWDDWKDEHPRGAGNKKLTPCG